MTGSDEHDMHMLTGAYSADALPPDERAAFEAHLDGCAPCRQEVAELTATTARLGAAATVPPPPALRDRVLAEVAHTRQHPPAVDRMTAPPPRAPWYRQPAAVAASILLVVAVGLGALAAVQWQRADRADDRASRIAAVATDPDRAQAEQRFGDHATGVVVAAHGRAIFRASGLPPLPGDRTYQLWVVRDGAMRPAGVLGRATSGDVQRYVEDLHPADQLGLTVEPKGGSKQPTTRPLVVVPLPA